MNNDVEYTIALNSLGWETLEIQRKRVNKANVYIVK